LTELEFEARKEVAKLLKVQPETLSVYPISFKVDSAKVTTEEPFTVDITVMDLGPRTSDLGPRTSVQKGEQMKIVTLTKYVSLGGSQHDTLEACVMADFSMNVTEIMKNNKTENLRSATEVTKFIFENREQIKAAIENVDKDLSQ
jgi:hypothetical protein